MLSYYGYKSRKFINKKGEKYPYWLGKNPDVLISKKGTVVLESQWGKYAGKVWDTLDDVEKWIGK